MFLLPVRPPFNLHRYNDVAALQVIRELVRSPNRAAAEKAVFMYTKNNFDVPGDKGFPMPGFFTAPQSRGEAGAWPVVFVLLPHPTLSLPRWSPLCLYLMYASCICATL